ncbi:MAG TPA: arginase family protein [Actinomycetota bacterium]
MSEDPHWPRASEWLAGSHAPHPRRRLAVLGVPLHLGSISPSRADLAPAAIREALGRYSTWDGETRGDIEVVAAEDHGDLPLADVAPDDALDSVVAAMQGLDAHALVLLGGDNSVTRPGVHGLGVPLDRLGLLTLDAHFDLRETDGGMRNGNPVRALLEDGLPGENVVQIGIQPFANSPMHAEVAQEAGITFVLAGEVRSRGIGAVLTEALEHLDARADSIYLDVDVDVLDRGFAPATPGSRPGGLAPWEIRRAARLAGRHPKVRAVDLVEIDPTVDVADVTTLAAAATLLAFAAGLAARS